MDMVRSLGIVLLIAAALLYLHRPPPDAARRIRVIDPVDDVRAFHNAVPAAALPEALPAGWRPTSSTYTAGPDYLRIGYITPGAQYAEYVAEVSPPATFVRDATGGGQLIGSVLAGGRSWQELRAGQGTLSLVRADSGLTIVLGGVRDSAALPELQALAAGLVPPG